MQFITYHHIIKCCVLLTHLFIPTMLLSLWLLDLLTFSGKKKQQQKPYQQSQYNTIYILPFLFIHYTIHSNPTLSTIFKQRQGLQSTAQIRPPVVMFQSGHMTTSEPSPRQLTKLYR